MKLKPVAPDHSPNSLIWQPACITLLKTIFVGGMQLLWGGDDGPDVQTSLLSHLKIQGVPAGRRPVVKYNPCKDSSEQLQASSRLPTYCAVSHQSNTSNDWLIRS